MLNYYYANSITDFLKSSKSEVIGEIVTNSRQEFTVEQLFAWETQIHLLQSVLHSTSGHIFFEFSIPRMGKRVDCILIVKNVVFVIEFKVGEKVFLKSDRDQVWDYALDLKNFHKPSHQIFMVPILLATNALNKMSPHQFQIDDDNLFKPVLCNAKELSSTILEVFSAVESSHDIDSIDYLKGVYEPTPTIIEAAVALFNNHNVENITRSDSDDIKLEKTTAYIKNVIEHAKYNSEKKICFITGVPGAGKTLAGLKIAIEHLDNSQGNRSVFLSGNKPLVDVLQEALTRDKVFREKQQGRKITKKEAMQSVKSFIQIIHHYRDEYLRKPEAPYDHIAIFDEAQRAWNKEQTVKFMHNKKGEKNFNKSEPEFLIECMDRHETWGVVICLVGGGQEINTGESGISAWLDSVHERFKNWEVHISRKLTDSEYSCQEQIQRLERQNRVIYNDNLHLSVSIRSFRAEYLSLFVKKLLDIDEDAKETYKLIEEKYPIVITRNIDLAKDWLKSKARGNERYGMLVSSQAYRLKPLAIDVKTPINHINWFLDGKDDVRSSFYLEDVATEFQVQGLELDWTCLIWDADFRFNQNQWATYSFKGSKWQNINNINRKKYLLNAYRVLLTRARHGMIIVVPFGNTDDQTRLPEFYDSTYQYLLSLGLKELTK